MIEKQLLFFTFLLRLVISQDLAWQGSWIAARCKGNDTSKCCCLPYEAVFVISQIESNFIAPIDYITDLQFNTLSQTEEETCKQVNFEAPDNLLIKKKWEYNFTGFKATAYAKRLSDNSYNSTAVFLQTESSLFGNCSQEIFQIGFTENTQNCWNNETICLKVNTEGCSLCSCREMQVEAGSVWCDSPFQGFSYYHLGISIVSTLCSLWVIYDIKWKRQNENKFIVTSTVFICIGDILIADAINIFIPAIDNVSCTVTLEVHLLGVWLAFYWSSCMSVLALRRLTRGVNKPDENWFIVKSWLYNFPLLLIALIPWILSIIPATGVQILASGQICIFQNLNLIWEHLFYILPPIFCFTVTTISYWLQYRQTRTQVSHENTRKLLFYPFGQIIGYGPSLISGLINLKSDLGIIFTLISPISGVVNALIYAVLLRKSNVTQNEGQASSPNKKLPLDLIRSISEIELEANLRAQLNA